MDIPEGSFRNVLLIGGRNQLAQQSVGSYAASPAQQPVHSAQPTSVDRRDPDPDPVKAEIDRAVGDYQRRLVEEHVLGEAAGVQVWMRLDGELARVEVAEHVPIRYGMDGLGELIVRATRAASVSAAQRREQLSKQITFFGEPALERAQQLAENPESSLEEMKAVRYW